jgi:hypothetical protein
MRGPDPRGHPMEPADPAGREREARRLARYLIGEDPLPGEAARYALALDAAALPLERERDRRLWALAMSSTTALGLVDAGLALVDPYSPVRQRVCLMLAVLEASPAHTRHFLSAPYPRAALLGLGLRMAGAALRSAGGFALVRSWGILWR